MKHLAALILMTLLAACSDPHFGASLDIGPNGVSVTPSLTGTLGGAHVSISG